MRGSESELRLHSKDRSPCQANDLHPRSAKFQAWNLGKSVVSEADRRGLNKAKKDGRLSEAMLDRRQKLKQYVPHTRISDRPAHLIDLACSPLVTNIVKAKLLQPSCTHYRRGSWIRLICYRGPLMLPDIILVTCILLFRVVIEQLEMANLDLRP